MYRIPRQLRTERATSTEEAMERSDGERKEDKFRDVTAELGSRNTEDKHPNNPKNIKTSWLI